MTERKDTPEVTETMAEAILRLGDRAKFQIRWQYPTVEGDGDWHDATIVRVDIDDTGIYYLLRLEDGETVLVGDDEVVHVV